MRIYRITAIASCIVLASCSHFGRTLGEWLAKAESLGAVSCDRDDATQQPEAYARCMGQAGADAAILIAAERLRGAVRRALAVPLPGTGAEGDEHDAEAARQELAFAVREWERVAKGKR